MRLYGSYEKINEEIQSLNILHSANFDSFHKNGCYIINEEVNKNG